MRSSNEQRHLHLLRHMWRLAGYMIVIVSVAAGVVGGMQFAMHNNVAKENAAAAQRTHFWRGIAGAEAIDQPTLVDQFARDIRRQLGPIDPTVQTLPSGILEFKGNSNRYGGITIELGDYNPFVGTGLGGEENGSFTPDMLSKLLLIKQGKVEQVLASEQQSAPVGGTPGLILATVIAWLIGGSILLIVAHRKAYRADQASHEPVYPRSFRTLEWRFDGDADKVECLTVLMAPLVLVPWICLRFLTDILFRMKAKMAFPSQYNMLVKAEREIRRLRKIDPANTVLQEMQLQLSTLRTRLNDAVRGEGIMTRRLSVAEDAARINEELNRLSVHITQTEREGVKE